MLLIAWQTLRTRRATLSGAFVALLLAVTLTYATGSLLAGALSAPGPGRFAAADAVVRAPATVTLGTGDDAESVAMVPAPLLDVAAVKRVAAVPGVERAIGDVAFDAGVVDARGRALGGAEGHGWPSAALTPYRLRTGHAPERSRDVVADVRLGVRAGQSVRIATPGGEGTYRVSGLVAGAGSRRVLFFAADTAARLSGAPDHVRAVGVLAAPGVTPEQLQTRLGPSVEVLGRDHAADADAGDPTGDRAALVAIFGVMGGIAGFVALFVVAGTFALAIAQRRRENAVLRALGATPRQVRRLIAGEALLVSLFATALGLMAGRPLAHAIVAALADHGVAPEGFEPSRSWIPLAAAAGGGILVAQLAVLAAARRAGRVRPAEALRDVAIEHGRPGFMQLLSGLLCLGGGAAMAILFSGEAALAFAILGGLLLALGTGLLGRWLLGWPAALLILPLRRLGAAGLLASTSLTADRHRTAALATPLVLIAMLVGTQGVLQASSQQKVERVTEARVTADQVVVGHDGAPLATDAAERLHGVGLYPTSVVLLDKGLGWDAPWPAAALDPGPGLDLRVTSGDVAAVRGRAVAVSAVVAREGHVGVGDTLRVRLADTTAATLRIAAVYERAAGLGDVVFDPAFARRHAPGLTPSAVFISGSPPARGALTRAQYLATLHASNNEDAWGVWLVVGLSVLFAALALINTAAMATAERRADFATIRLLGGTSGHVTRMLALELVPTLLVALLAGTVIAAVAMVGVPDGVRGIPIVVPVVLAGGLGAGAVALALAAGGVAVRIALRVTPAGATRG